MIFDAYPKQTMLNPVNSYANAKNEYVNTFFVLGFKKVKQPVLRAIALIVAVLLTLPRVLSMFNIVEQLTESFTAATINDIVFRFVFLAFFYWAVLQCNTNLRFLYESYSTLVRYLLTILLNIILFSGAILLFAYLYPVLTEQSMHKSEQGLVYFVYFIILLILIFVSRVLRYQIIHKDDIIQNELLKQQKLHAELAALKNQINPHFLFNSLNSLNTLVRDNREAITFVNKLSFMYRYILQSGNQDLATVQEELEFLESYVHLIKTRYRDRFTITIDVEDQWMNTKVPILAIQLLVENAVKHNEISENLPLHVRVFSTEKHLVVENKIQPRNTFVDSTGNGLVNLKKRYFLLKNRQIVITNKNKVFRVKLPLN